MTGLTNYTAQNELNYVTGQIAQPALPAVWLALFTAVGTDAGSGFTEVSGGSYARVQVAGVATAAGTISTGSATITMPNVSGFPWVVAGMAVYDTTNSKIIGTVSTWIGTTLTLTGNATNNGSGATDVLSISAFSNSTGTAPSTVTNGAVITFAQATANWGTVIAFGLYDAVSSGNFLVWDFMGNFAWLPFESTNVGSGNGPVFSAKANGYSNNDAIVFTAEYGGTLPTLTAGTITSYTVNFVANVAADSFTATQTAGGSAITSSSTGSGNVRKITQQSIPINVTASFAASTLTITAA